MVKKKLSTKFPLTSPTIELLEKVTEFVLKQPSLRWQSKHFSFSLPNLVYRYHFEFPSPLLPEQDVILFKIGHSEQLFVFKIIEFFFFFCRNMHLFKAVGFLMPKVFQNPVRPCLFVPELYSQPWRAKKPWKTNKQLFNIANAVHRILVFMNSVLYMKCPKTFALSWARSKWNLMKTP